MATPYAQFDLEGTGSTQDDAARLLADHAAVVVSATRQSAGRGRLGRGWTNAPRALAVSVGFRSGWPPDTWPRISLVAGLAARDALGETLRLKWPNDLMRGGFKVGGILTEAGGSTVIVGLGANLFWPRAPVGYGAVFDRVDRVPGSSPLASHFADALFERLDRGPDDWGHDEYRAVCVTLGQDLRWEPGGSGRATDIGRDGSLLVLTAGGPEALMSGEVHEVRHADADVRD